LRSHLKIPRSVGALNQYGGGQDTPATRTSRMQTASLDQSRSR
jgi:hypothetical protein